MADLIVIGHGPAGLQAAIYGVRAGLDVLCVGRDAGALGTSDRIENYLGFVEPVSGPELLSAGKRQAERLGVRLRETEVTGIRYGERFTVDTADGSEDADAVILATGMPRRTVALPGVKEYEGRGVSYCAVCDAFFYRRKTVAVIGSGEYALHEAADLKPVAAKIYMLTHGDALHSGAVDPQYEVIEDRIERLEGDDEKVRRVVFTSARQLEIDGVFIALGTASALDLAVKLGLENDGTALIVNDRMETNVPGVFACGDCTGGLLQIAVAVGEGAWAGMSAVAYVRAKHGQKASAIQWH